MEANRDFVRRNELSRIRLQELVGRLTEQNLDHDLGEGWTVAVALAHVAFWDHAQHDRWELWVENPGSNLAASDPGDVANTAGLPIWRALPGTVAGQLALEAARRADERIARLGPEAIRAALDADLEYMFDRSLHRLSHVEQIEAALIRL